MDVNSREAIAVSAVIRPVRPVNQEAPATAQPEQVSRVQPREVAAPPQTAARPAQQPTSAQQAQPNPQDSSYQRASDIPEVAVTALENAISYANEQLLGVGRHLEYSIHEPTNTIVVRVVDTNTNETVREIPPESRLDAAYRIREASGINVDNFV
ncbi:MAG: flagellar protein FlaG [Defluviitaleaceae bacterium]|nr:flagellar protein FlaG [Defluviitaleaceae bacterium]